MTTTAHIQEGNAGMTNLTPERIEEIRKRLEAATPGPWHVDTHTCYIWGPKGEMVADQDLANRKVAENAVARIRGAGAGLPMAANMDFIANAPRDISDLLSAYDAISRDGMREALVKAFDEAAAVNEEAYRALSPDAPRQKVDQYQCECVKCGKRYIGAKRSSICPECKSDAPDGCCTKCGGGHGSNESCSGPPRPSQPPKYIPRG